MAWYGRRRSGEPRVGARAVVVGLGLAMVGVLAIQTSTTVRNGIDASRRSMDAVTVKLTNLSSGVKGWTFGFGRSKEDLARIAELEAEVRDLHRWRDLAETMTLRMERYEKLLGLVGETQGQSVMARVVAEENGPFAASRIANAGAANGVRAGYTAVNENGLVGRVVRVGEYTSRILLVTDGASNIPVMGTQSGDRALLVGTGNSAAMLEEPETPDKIVEGEIWVTSGDDGQTPLGIRVGRARRTETGWSIDLAMRQGPVDFIRLVPPPDFATPEAVPALNEREPQRNSESNLVSVVAPLSREQPAGAATPGAAPQRTAPRPVPAQPQPAQAPATESPAQAPAAQAPQGDGQ
ncbi:MAG TPA: rod shape-determining protein MreC [Hyphomonadaceae bacterium]|nr:rod shape-determining protein MreC [Hyphomonadaceae bacterium]